MKYFALIALSSVFIVLVSVGCSFFSETEQAEISFPLGGKWAARTSGSDAEFTFGSTSENSATFLLNVQKNLPTAVVATHIETQTVAGTIYPYSTCSTPTWTFAAEVFYSLSKGSECSDEATQRYLSYFNWKRFEEELRAFGDDVNKLDKERIMKKIASHSFKKTDLKLK